MIWFPHFIRRSPCRCITEHVPPRHAQFRCVICGITCCAECDQAGHAVGKAKEHVREVIPPQGDAAATLTASAAASAAVTASSRKKRTGSMETVSPATATHGKPKKTRDSTVAASPSDGTGMATPTTTDGSATQKKKKVKVKLGPDGQPLPTDKQGRMSVMIDKVGELGKKVVSVTQDTIGTY
jgi:hypothetical protein